MEKVKIICALVLVGMFLSVRTSVGAVDVNCSTGESLQAAINSNDENATFNVTGTCNENITISEFKESVTIQPKAGQTAAIVGPNAGINTVTIRGQGVTVRGLTISGGYDGIQVARGGTATIDGNTIQNASRNGITVALSSFATIIGNTITGNSTLSPTGRGINVSENSSARIGFSSTADTAAPNTIQNHGGPGIEVDRSATARIVGNTVSGNGGTGILVTRGSTAAISNNTINDNGGAGIYVGYGSLASLGNPGGSTIFDFANSTSVNNDYSGLACEMGATVTGLLGTLTGDSGPFNSVGTGITTSELQNHEGINFLTGGASRMTIAGNGNVGIGTRTPTSPFSIVSPSAGNLFSMETTAPVGGAGFEFKVPTGGYWFFKATMDNGFKIRDATNLKDVVYFQYGTGNVGIGTNNPGYMLDVAGPIRVQTTVYSSSKTLKDNITDLKSSEALEALKVFNPVKFNYKTDLATRHIGFIAEDVPNLVAQKNRDAIDPMDIIAVLTKVVQEQQRTMQEQQDMVEQQQKLISAHSERISELEKALQLKGTLPAVQ